MQTLVLLANASSLKAVKRYTLAHTARTFTSKPLTLDFEFARTSSYWLSEADVAREKDRSCQDTPVSQPGLQSSTCSALRVEVKDVFVSSCG